MEVRQFTTKALRVVGCMLARLSAGVLAVLWAISISLFSFASAFSLAFVRWGSTTAGDIVYWGLLVATPVAFAIALPVIWVAFRQPAALLTSPIVRRALIINNAAVALLIAAQHLTPLPRLF